MLLVLVFAPDPNAHTGHTPLAIMLATAVGAFLLDCVKSVGRHFQSCSSWLPIILLGLWGSIMHLWLPRIISNLLFNIWVIAESSYWLFHSRSLPWSDRVSLTFTSVHPRDSIPFSTRSLLSQAILANLAVLHRSVLHIPHSVYAITSGRTVGHTRDMLPTCDRRSPSCASRAHEATC